MPKKTEMDKPLKVKCVVCQREFDEKKMIYKPHHDEYVCSETCEQIWMLDK